MNIYRFCLGIMVFPPACAFADVGDGGCWSGWGRMGPGFGGMFMWILLLVAVGLIAYFLVRASKEGNIRGPHETPLDLLKKRYARGEITKERYEEIKQDLEE